MLNNSSTKQFQRYSKVLGLGEHQPKTEYVCFLPWWGEFGWYIMNHVKRVHGYNHSKKIVCIKFGHECLFPSAHDFYYDWPDVPDIKKAGVGSKRQELENKIKKEILAKYSDVTFISPQDTSWEEKKTLGHIRFIPKNLRKYGLKVDVVITPRKRQIDAQRNFKHWQRLIDALKKEGLTVGAIGHEGTSFSDLHGLSYKSWDYIDVDSDVEMIRNCQVVVGQESGLAYLTMLCEKPLFIIDIAHKDVADEHRNESVPYIQLLGKPLAERVKLIKSHCQP